MNKKYELFRWLSDICKTASWVGGGVLSYFHVPHGGIGFIAGTLVYFVGMQAVAFKLHIKSLEEMED